MFKREEVKAIGFDLDGTLYAPSEEINDRVRTQIARKILEKSPFLETIDRARQYFESRYQEIQSGSKVLSEVGYKDPSIIIDECLAKADVLDLIKEDRRLAKFLAQLRENNFVYLLTHTPRELGVKKLQRLGIIPELFDRQIYSDTINTDRLEGKPFQYAIDESGIPPKNHVYIGDRKQSDIIPANRLGMQTIAVWSKIPEATLSLPTIHDIEGVFA